ncbi:MAG: hypothetical protein P8Y97_22380, partial [Candidatus Lokiarchaeota archaeon]
LKKTILKLVIIVDLITLISGISLLVVYFTDYGYGREIYQDNEFWAIFRSGGGDSSPGSIIYKNTLPLSADVSDLSDINLHFNISTLNKTSFWIPVQLIYALSDPGFPIISTPWTQHFNDKELQYNDWVWKHFGQFTPRNITIYPRNLSLNVFANDSNYTFNWSFPYDCYTEENGSLVGRCDYIESWLDYNPSGGFTFYIPYDNKTVIYPKFNSDLSWNFSITAFWDVKFHQFIGPNATFIGNATLATWVFKNESANVISVDITFDNSHYSTPIPIYTVIQRPPWIEFTLIGIGSATAIIVYIYDLKVKKAGKDRQEKIAI